MWYTSDAEEEALVDPIYRWHFLHRRKGEIKPCWHPGGHVNLLPSQPQKARVGFPVSDSWLIYGQPKIGKTTLAASFPDVFFIDLEEGASEIDGVIVSKPKSLDELSEVLEGLEGPYGKKFATIVIDSIDVVYDWIEQETCLDLSKKFKMKIDNIGEGPNGADWAEARKRLLGFVQAWRQLGKTIVFIAHAKSVMSEKGAITQKARTIDLPGKLAHRFPAKVDHIAFCYAEKEKDSRGKTTISRFISFQPYEDLEAGSRCKELQGQIVPMSFDAIRECFSKSSTKTLKPAQARR